MYCLTRWALRISLLANSYAFVLMTILGWPWSGLIIAAVNAGRVLRRKKARLTTLGQARFAEEADLKKSGMLAAGKGMILGRMPVNKKIIATAAALLNPRLSASQAVDKFAKLFDRNPSVLIRLNRAIHTVFFGPSGAGKGVSFVLPFLMDCPDSCVVVDFKGENARLTAEHRRKNFGHQTVFLDPFKVVTNTPDTFNPLDWVCAESPLAIDECNDLAKSVVVREPEEKERHFNDAAESWISGFCAFVVQYAGLYGIQSLQTVKELFSNPAKLDLTVRGMLESDAWDGMLARLGGQLSHMVDREKASVLSTVARHLRFLDTLSIAANTKISSFDPAKLRTGKMTIYLILPPEFMRTQSPLLRLWISSMLRAVIRGGLQEKKLVHFILDEAASLGQMDVIEDLVDKYRGYGVRGQCYYQSVGQLKKCWPNGQDQTLLSNTTQIFFGVNDYATAELVSNRLGEYTAIVESGGTSFGRSSSSSNGASPQESVSYSSNTNHGWSQQARRLLKPEEIMQLPARVALTFVPGMAPVWSVLLRYYEEPWLGQRPSKLSRFRRSFKLLTLSVLVLLFSFFLAMVITAAMCHTMTSSQSLPF